MIDLRHTRAIRTFALLLPLICATLASAQDNVTRYTGPFTITGIVVEGNKTTKERVIIREMMVREGDTLRTSDQIYYLLERSRQNVVNMALFNSVRIVPTYLNEHGIFITITVSERWFYWPTPIFKYSDPNFNTWWLTKDFRRVYWGAFLYRYNMRGRNETLYAKVQLGYTKEFALRYRFPFIDKKQKVGMAFGAGYTTQDEITIGTVNNKRLFLKIPGQSTRNEWKADVEATLRPGFDMKHTFRLGFVSAHVLDTVPRTTDTYFGKGQTQEKYFSAGYMFSYDARDSKIYPRSGYYADCRIDRYGLGFGGQNEPGITTVVGTLLRSWRVGERWSFGGSARGKATIGPPPPYYNQVALGYDDYVRGYEYSVLDGEHFVLGKANALWALLKPHEYIWEQMKSENFRTLSLAIYLNAFVDAGYAWNAHFAPERNRLSNDWQYSYGIGINVLTIYDQIMRVEYTINRQEQSAFYLHFAQPF